MKIKVAVIGTGIMGKHHLKVYSQLPLVEVVAISDIDETNGVQIAKQYNTRYYSNFKQMLETEVLDAVSICVPTSAHFLVASYCLKKKIHILLEKPITADITQAKKLVTLARKAGVTFVVGHIERYNPGIVKVKEMLEHNQLGDVTAITSRRIGGSPSRFVDTNIAVDLAIHDIDIANYLLNAKPLKVFSNTQRYLIAKHDDSVEFFLQYKKTSVYIQANWISPVKIRKLTITGTEGYLELDYITQTIELYKSSYNKFNKAARDFSDYILLFSDPDKLTIAVEKKEPLKEEIIYFLSCIQKNIQPDPIYAVNALQVALKK